MTRAGEQAVEALIASTLSDPRVDLSTRETLERALARADLSPRAFTEFCAEALVFARGAARDPKLLHTMQWLGELAERVAPRSPGESSKGTERATVAKVYFSPGEAPGEAIRGEFHRARKSADVCVFTITDDRISEALVGAHRRGVSVRVISDNDKAYDEGSDVAKIKSAGVRVKIDETEAHMHHKFAVFDEERVLTGSYNWTRSAGRYNAENLVITDDSRLVSEFSGHFEKLWAELG